MGRKGAAMKAIGEGIQALINAGTKPNADAILLAGGIPLATTPAATTPQVEATTMTRSQHKKTTKLKRATKQKPKQKQKPKRQQLKAAMEGQAYVDEVVDSATEEAEKAIRADMNKLLDVITASRSYEELKENLEAMYASMNADGLADAMQKALVLASMNGMDSVLEEDRAENETERQHTAHRGSTGVLPPQTQPHLRVAAQRVFASLKGRAIRLANKTQLDMVAYAYKQAEAAIAEGKSFAEFTQTLKERVPPKLLQTVKNAFREGVQSAYMKARVEAFSTPDLLIRRPFWRYVALLDAVTTAICRACNGTTRPSGHPWWKTHIPPLHSHCRSIPLQKHHCLHNPKAGKSLRPHQAPEKHKTRHVDFH